MQPPATIPALPQKGCRAISPRFGLLDRIEAIPERAGTGSIPAVIGGKPALKVFEVEFYFKTPTEIIASLVQAQAGPLS
ncbi:hypothetical protein GCM10022626_10260 [[Pseudomonas] carboxydohydrogena]